MEKNQLKFYEAPAVEVVEMEVQGMLCTSGGGYTEGSDEEFV